MKVQAAPGLNVPKEDKPHDYITDAEAVDVPDTAYYQRRVTDGDLVEVITKNTTKGAA
jgi:hypothetical protein